jgi:TRAP transporter TAXI family solute receptor
MLWVGALLLFVATLGVSVWLFGEPPPRRIVLATGDPAGGFAAFGKQYKDRLDRMGLKVQLLETHGSIDNLERLRRHEADVAFVQAGVAELLPDTSGLCGLAAVDSEPLWVFARSEKPVASLRDLKGLTVALGPADSGSAALGRQLLEVSGVTAANTSFVHLSMEESRKELTENKVNAALIVCPPNAPVLRELLREPNVRMVSLRNQQAIANRFRFLRRVDLPAGALDLEHELPPQDTALLAPVTVLAAREDLHPRVVEQVLMTAHAVHSPGSLVDEPGRFPTLEGIDLPPNAAAERFMKSGESFLSRVLPYWGVRLVSQAQLLLLPLLTLLPMWKALPVLYSFRTNRILKRHYTALREVEGQIDRCEDPAELRKLLETLDGLRTGLETLSRKLPAHLQRDVYHWRLHVAMVRAEGSDRLRRLEAGSPVTA